MPCIAASAGHSLSQFMQKAAQLRNPSLLRVYDFGIQLLRYGPALELQKRLAEEVKSGDLPDVLLQLQHPAVYTLGKRGTRDSFRSPVETLRSLGTEIFEVARGGETTFHGPGQLVLYPIVNLRRLRRGARAYVEGLEDTVIHALRGFGIVAQGRQPSRTGVWVGDRKIAAIGVQISSGTTTHGLAVNVATDLEYFKHIVPCGIADKEVTSVETEIGRTGCLADVSNALRASFVKEFRYDAVEQQSAESLMV